MNALANLLLRPSSWLLAALGAATLWAGTGCSTVDESRVLSSRICRFRVQGYTAEVREETGEGDKTPTLYFALTGLDSSQRPYAIDGFRQGEVFRISLQSDRRSRHGVSTVWGTAPAPHWQAPAMTVSEGRVPSADDVARAGELLEQASLIAGVSARWRPAAQRSGGPIALRLP